LNNLLHGPCPLFLKALCGEGRGDRVHWHCFVETLCSEEDEEEEVEGEEIEEDEEIEEEEEEEEEE